MTRNITKCRSIYDTAQCKTITIEILKEMIESPTGTIREVTLKIQESSDDFIKNRLKSFLPVVLANGEFNERKSSGLVDYSCFIIIDFDYNFPEEKGLRDREWKLFKTSSFVRLMYRSPRGGIKVIVEHNNIDPAFHGDLYDAVARQLGSKNIDLKCKDLSRANYISYDPTPFYDPSSSVFNFTPPTTATPFVKTSTRIVSPTSITAIKRHYRMIPFIQLKNPTKNAEYSIISAVQAWSDKEFPLCKGHRNSHLFKFACALHDRGIHKQTALEYLTLKYIAPDFRYKEIKSVITSAYKHGRYRRQNP